MRFRPNKSGNKYQKGKITSYTVSIALSILEKSGLSVEDEIEVIAEEGKIIISKKMEEVAKGE